MIQSKESQGYYLSNHEIKRSSLNSMLALQLLEITINGILRNCSNSTFMHPVI